MFKKTPSQLAEAVPAASWVDTRVATRHERMQGDVSAVKMEPNQASDNSGGHMQKLTMRQVDELLPLRSDPVPRDLRKQFSISQATLQTGGVKARVLSALGIGGSKCRTKARRALLSAGTALRAFVLGAACLVIANRGLAVGVFFNQLDYEAMGTVQSSDWGQANILFDSGDLGLFTQNADGSYVGYVNIVTTVAGGSTNNWAVENLPMYFPSISAYLNQTPDGVWFSLGTSNTVSSLSYGISVSPTPLATAPMLTLSGATVTAQATTNYGVVPDANGNVVSDGWASFFASPAANFVGAPAGSSLGPGASGMDDNKVPTLNVTVANTCGAESAARSLAKLGVANAQTAYNTLHPILYPGGTNAPGDWTTNFINAKTKYPGVTTIFTTNTAEVVKKLKAGADVEWWIQWKDASKTNAVAHQVFINSIQPLSVGGYEITGFDTFGKHTWNLRPDGSWLGPLVGSPGGGNSKSVGFFVETTNPPPTVSYNWNGGGKYLASAGQASIVRVALNGMASQDASGNFTSSGPVSGSLTAFDSLTRTEIVMQTFSLVEGSSLGGGNFTVGGQGLGTVNGTPTVINFEASKAGGVVTVKISDAETGEVLVSGSGEQDRADMQLTIIPTGSGNPVIKSMTTLPDGNVQILALGIPNTSYLVQATTNMINPSWATIGTATTAADGLAWFTDLHATNFPTRFYRLWLP
jgi:hypothetical protein